MNTRCQRLRDSANLYIDAAYMALKDYPEPMTAESRAILTASLVFAVALGEAIEKIRPSRHVGGPL